MALTDDVMMPAVRAHMVLAALSDHGDVLGSMPAPDGLEQFAGREIDAWIASDHEDETIKENVGAISEVATVEVTDVTKPEGPPAEQTAPEAPADTAAAETAPRGCRDSRPRGRARHRRPSLPQSSRRPPPRPRPQPRRRPSPPLRSRAIRTRPPAPCASTPNASTR